VDSHAEVKIEVSIAGERFFFPILLLYMNLPPRARVAAESGSSEGCLCLEDANITEALNFST